MGQISSLRKQHDTRLRHGPQDLNRLTTEGLLHLRFSFMSSTGKTILWRKFHVDDVQTLGYIASVSFLPCLSPILITLLSFPIFLLCLRL